MSYWVYLCVGDEDGEPVTVTQHAEGGTYAIGGTDEAMMNVTYNYNARYVEVWDGASLAEALHGKKASEVLPGLERAVEKLGTTRSADYWEPTAGNAGHTLNILLSWARQYPDAVFAVH